MARYVSAGACRKAVRSVAAACSAALPWIDWHPAVMRAKVLGMGAVVLPALIAPSVSWATDLQANLTMPSFGGSNTAALSMEQLQNSQIAATNAAKAQAIANAEAAVNPSAATNAASQAFANAIMSQLDSIVSEKIALQITNSSPGTGGTITANGVTLTYVNSDGQLTIDVTTPSGSSVISLPCGC